LVGTVYHLSLFVFSLLTDIWLILQHTGDLGNIVANEDGRAIFYFKDKLINVSNLIGRSVGITENEDDGGKTKINTSAIDGNSGKRYINNSYL